MKYAIKVNKEYIKSMNEYEGAAPKPLLFESKDEADLYIYMNNLKDAVVEVYHG